VCLDWESPAPSYGTRRRSSATFLSLNLFPMNRFTLWKVFRGSVVSLFCAPYPTKTPPSTAKCTTEGVVLRPCSSGTSTGRPSITTATALFVVPKSMPQMEAIVGGGAPRVRGAPRRQILGASRGTTRTPGWCPRHASEETARGEDIDITGEACDGK
jgi:hypothetical protein